MHMAQKMPLYTKYGYQTAPNRIVSIFSVIKIDSRVAVHAPVMQGQKGQSADFLKFPERAKLAKSASQPVFKRSLKGPNLPKGPVSRFFFKRAKRASQPVLKGPGKGQTGQKGQSAGF